MSKAPKYFMYFPGNYRWSAAFVNMLGTAPFGGVDMSEMHASAGCWRAKGAEDDEAWFERCERVANIVRGHAEQFRAERHPLVGGFVSSARLSLLSDGRTLPHAEGRPRA